MKAPGCKFYSYGFQSRERVWEQEQPRHREVLPGEHREQVQGHVLLGLVRAAQRRRQLDHIQHPRRADNFPAAADLPVPPERTPR